MIFPQINPRLSTRRDDVEFSINNVRSTVDEHPLIGVCVYVSQEDEEFTQAYIRLDDLQQLVRIIAELNQNYGSGSLEM